MADTTMADLDAPEPMPAQATTNGIPTDTEMKEEQPSTEVHSLTHPLLPPIPPANERSPGPSTLKQRPLRTPRCAPTHPEHNHSARNTHPSPTRPDSRLDPRTTIARVAAPTAQRAARAAAAGESARVADEGVSESERDAAFAGGDEVSGFLRVSGSLMSGEAVAKMVEQWLTDDPGL